MKSIDDLAALRSWRSACDAGQRIGFVPTMGALHEGHRSLIRAARRDCDCVVVSVFVNPTQFAPGEDLDRYPRNRAGDERILADEGVDIAWFAQESDLYPEPPRVQIEVPTLTRGILCGRTRPDHFAGVALIVSKLFHCVGPDRAYFGRKDFQQLVVVQTLARDLNFPVEIVPCPIVRETDGLALSSRNVGLSPQGRASALALSRGLSTATASYRAGEKRASILLSEAERVLREAAGVELEYLELVCPRTLERVDVATDEAVLAVAARVDGVRLIDNTVLGEDS